MIMRDAGAETYRFRQAPCSCCWWTWHSWPWIPQNCIHPAILRGYLLRSSKDQTGRLQNPLSNLVAALASLSIPSLKTSFQVSIIKSKHFEALRSPEPYIFHSVEENYTALVRWKSLLILFPWVIQQWSTCTHKSAQDAKMRGYEHVLIINPYNFTAHVASHCGYRGVHCSFSEPRVPQLPRRFNAYHRLEHYAWKYCFDVVSRW